MRCWSTFTAAAVALALGASSAAAEAPKSPRPASGWEQPSIGRLGPLGTSNSLFQLALASRTPTAGAPMSGSGSGNTEGSDSTKHGVPVYAIAGGAAGAAGSSFSTSKCMMSRASRAMSWMIVVSETRRVSTPAPPSVAS